MAPDSVMPSIDGSAANLTKLVGATTETDGSGTQDLQSLSGTETAESGNAERKIVAPQSSAMQVQPPIGQAQVREIQIILGRLGFDAGPPDGIMGPTTARAISDFQRSAGMVVDGRPSNDLLARLRETGAEQPESQPADAPETSSPPDKTQETKEETRPSAAAESFLVGTEWRITDETGSTTTIEFAANGMVKGIMYERFWSWRETDGEVGINYDNGMGLSVKRTGRLSSDHSMSGQAMPSRGEGWSWSAERISPPPSSETNPETDVGPTALESDGKPQSGIPEPEPAVDQRPADTAETEPVNTDPAKAGETAAPSSDTTPSPSQIPRTDVETATGDKTPAPPPAMPEAPAESRPAPPSSEPDDVASAEPPETNEAPDRAPRVYGEQNANSRIVILAKDDSWLEIAGADGEIIFSRVLRKGDSYRAPSLPGARFVTGNAGGLKILVDGEPVPDLGPTAKVRRDVQLDPNLLKAGTAWAPQQREASGQ